MTTEQIILIVLYFIVGLLLWIAYPIFYGAPWIPTPRKKVHNMLELAEVNNEDVVYDLGSGDGRIIIMAAEVFGARSVGIEIDFIRVLLSRFAIRRNGLSHLVNVIRGNFFKVDFSEATVVTIYQGIEVNNKLREKLLHELKPGTRIVSHTFIFKDWTPIKANEETENYLYIVN